MQTTRRVKKPKKIAIIILTIAAIILGVLYLCTARTEFSLSVTVQDDVERALEEEISSVENIKTALKCAYRDGYKEETLNLLAEEISKNITVKSEQLAYHERRVTLSLSYFSSSAATFREESFYTAVYALAERYVALYQKSIAAVRYFDYMQTEEFFSLPYYEQSRRLRAQLERAVSLIQGNIAADDEVEKVYFYEQLHALLPQNNPQVYSFAVKLNELKRELIYTQNFILENGVENPAAQKTLVYAAENRYDAPTQALLKEKFGENSSFSTATEGKKKLYTDVTEEKIRKFIADVQSVLDLYNRESFRKAAPLAKKYAKIDGNTRKRFVSSFSPFYDIVFLVVAALFSLYVYVTAFRIFYQKPRHKKD